MKTRAAVRASLDRILSVHPFVLLDGAVGTELERRGYQTRLPIWTANAAAVVPELLLHIHRDYLDAGADILTANTFRTTRHTLGKAHSAHEAETRTKDSIAIARQAIEASGRSALLAASLAPLEDNFEPARVPSDDQIEKAYTEQITILQHTDADFLLCETMINKAEIAFVCKYCAGHEIPFMLSLSLENGSLPDGTAWTEIAPLISAADPIALLVNCRAPQILLDAIKRIHADSDILPGAYGNAPGNPSAGIPWDISANAIAKYTESAMAWFQEGARIIGGCCGTTPDFIAALADLRKTIRTPE